MTIIAGVAGALAGVPVAAIAYAVPAEGPVRLPHRWWTGAPAPRLATTAVALVAGASSALVSTAIGAAVVLPAFCLVATPSARAWPSLTSDASAYRTP